MEPLTKPLPPSRGPHADFLAGCWLTGKGEVVIRLGRTGAVGEIVKPILWGIFVEIGKSDSRARGSGALFGHTSA